MSICLCWVVKCSVCSSLIDTNLSRTSLLNGSSTACNISTRSRLTCNCQSVSGAFISRHFVTTSEYTLQFLPNGPRCLQPYFLQFILSGKVDIQKMESVPHDSGLTKDLLYPLTFLYPLATVQTYQSAGVLLSYNNYLI